MCGINGVISWLKDDEIDIQKMNDEIIHRGPDSEGIYSYKKINYHIKMGMRRLAIIDLNQGNQPIHSDDEKISIIFNGEIYNFPEIRNKLIQEGIYFKTHSDTEVILKLYKMHGLKGFQRLDGMFAFSIHDKIKDKIILARDYFGEKPLYLYHSKDKIIWSSELKSMVSELGHRPDINKTALNLYFNLTYIPAPYTIYQGISKLSPNSILEINLNSKEVTQHPILKFENTTKKENIPFEKAKKEVRKLVEDSVNSRSISDVPIGTFLSGGVDSSIVSLVLSNLSAEPINTFSVGFEKEEFDESDKSSIVAKKINSKHHSFILHSNDIRDDLSLILNNFDEPFADSSALPSYFIANKTSQHVKVVLTGDGGDEVFGGYNKYKMGKINKTYTKFVPEFIHKKLLKHSRSLLNQNEDSRGLKYKIQKVLKSIDYNSDFYFKILSLGFGDSRMLLLTPETFENYPFEIYRENLEIPKTLSDFRDLDRIISLEGDMLVKVDRTSMLNSLETRAPFLNKKLWDFTMQLPEEYLINKSSKKHILKKAFEEEFPKGFLDRKKQGFGVPVGDWLKSSLKNELLSFTNSDFLKNQNIFNIGFITELVKNHLNSSIDNSIQVWTFYCFQKWYLDVYLKLK